VCPEGPPWAPVTGWERGGWGDGDWGVELGVGSVQVEVEG